MRLIVNGACGKTGGTLCEFIEKSGLHKVAAYVDYRNKPDAYRRRYTSLDQFYGDADCIIDFSHRSFTEAVCSYAVERKLPAVIATTGQSEDELNVIRAASRFVPVMLSANLSEGIALLRRLVRCTVSAFPDADIEITEIHQNGKTDSPSGTAVMLAREAAEIRPDAVIAAGRTDGGRRNKDEITVHSLRIGDTAGTHTVYAGLPGQTIVLTHISSGRLPYAEGAVAAASFLVGKNAGLYTEKDMFDGQN